MYRVYQLRKEFFHGRAFRSYEEIKREFGEPQKEWYNLVYESEGDLTPEEMFYMFNMERPEDFKGHSLSVSDVVWAEDGYWFCDDFGWAELNWGE